METAGRALPTGCYKCGLPGHWSRDCPSDPSQTPNSSNPRPASSPASTLRAPATVSNGHLEEKSASKPKKLPRSRPKLTPQLLLSDDGLGYVLRHFPRNFKYRGRGHEVSDLGNLIGMYREWHAHLLPYYSFDQFVLKVENVAATNQVKRCIRELRDRVAHGGDLTKLHETPCEDDIPNNSQVQTEVPSEATNTEETNQHDNESPFEHHTVDDMQEDIFNDMFEQAIENQPPSIQNDVVAAVVPPVTPSSGNIAGPSNTQNMSEEQKARMEANRLKALEKAASRAPQSQAT